MRSRILFVLVCLAPALVSPKLARAQFQPPTKEELQMTEDPKAPGAAAVYLNREETTDDNLHFHGYYERIKVLKEKGKELATVRIPYERSNFKVSNIEGRTIHPDGTIIQLTAKPADLIDVKTAGYQVNTMVFTLPSVEVGSILEYRLNIRYDDNIVSSPEWTVQQPYFVHKAHYFFSPSKGGGTYILNSRGEAMGRLMFGVHTGNGAQVVHDNLGRYTFDITDVPPIPTEDWMPPLNSLTWRVNFYYTQYISGEEFWRDEGKHWAKDAEKFANPSKTLQQAASAIVAPGDTDEQKARKIYAAVMQLDNTNFSRQKSEAERKKEKLKDIKNAEDVWNQKSGTANDLALLYVALARGAGLQTYPMQVVNRNRAIFDPDFLSLNQLDDYIAIVVIGGKEVSLDPGQKNCPFGLLQWKHAFANGLRLSATGPGFAQTPAGTYAQSGLTRIADLNVDADGNLTGTARFVMSGSEALRWRQLALENDTDEVKKQFNESMRAYIPEGVQADLDHFLGLGDYDSQLIGIVKLTGNIGAVTGKRFFLPGLFFESRARHPFVAEEKRAIPIDVHYPRLEQDGVTYHLPAGYDVESAPQATSLSWPDHALMKIETKASGGTVTVTRAMAYNYTLLDPKDYSGLHDFFQKVATADQQQLVLTRTSAAAKGN
jgi:Domain of Unknown Function with PDB structure (DUF3857)/Transglutaminase-like superfamily